MRFAASYRYCCRPIFVAALLLCLAFSFNWSYKNICKQTLTKTDMPGLVASFVPERLRSFVAARFWARADELMHRGPFPGSRQQFVAGSLSGNSDIVPLLYAVITIMPEELAPYQLLSRCLAGLQADGRESLQVLQQGIISNPGHPAVHELYAAAAWLVIFSGGGRPAMISASRYLEKATELYSKEAVGLSSDPAFNVTAYQTLLARLYLELDEPQKALQAWQKSGQDLDGAKDRLAEVLRFYRDSGRLPDERFPSIMADSRHSGTSQQSDTAHNHEDGKEHDACDLCHDQVQKTPPFRPFYRPLLAGFLVSLLLIAGRVRARG